MKTYTLLISILFFLIHTPSFAQFEYKQHLEGAEISAITSDGSSIWVATYGQGLHRYVPQTGKWQTFSVQNGNAENDFYYCLAVSYDFIWAGSSDGLYIYDRSKHKWKKKTFPATGEYGNWVRALCYDEDQNVLWIGRFKNVARYDVKNDKYTDYELTRNGNNKTNTFITIKKEGRDYIWFGTEAGVYRYDKSRKFNSSGSMEYYTNKGNAFKDAGKFVSISDLLFEDDYIWFANEEFITPDQPNFNTGGLYRYNRRALWQRFDERDGLPGNGVNVLARTGNKIWAATYRFDSKTKEEMGQGMILIDRITGKVTRVNPDDIYLGSDNVKDLFFDGTNMWIGTNIGLWSVQITNPLAFWNGKRKSR